MRQLLLIRGGCDIGSRPIDLHLSSFKKMGIDIDEETGIIKYKTNDIKKVLPHIDQSASIENQIKEALKMMLRG